MLCRADCKCGGDFAWKSRENNGLIGRRVERKLFDQLSYFGTRPSHRSVRRHSSRYTRANDRRSRADDRAFSVLFLCTHNGARSILAESILRKDGGGQFNAYSAGSHPKSRVNPLALKTLEAFEYPVEGFRSKSWEEFMAPDAPELDFVITVCDSAAAEACPAWPGHPMTAHWGIADPAAVDGTDIEKERAFNQAFRYLKNRIAVFIALPVRSLNQLSLRTASRKSAAWKVLLMAKRQTHERNGSRRGRP